MFRKKEFEMAETCYSQFSQIAIQRLYQCPCKKTYKSYPALYTHIKNKHDGIPPGNIKKPKSMKKLGRPPKILSKYTIQTEYLQSKSQASFQSSQEQIKYREVSSSTPDTCINQIVAILVSLPRQIICRQRLHEINAMMEMAVFLTKNKENNLKKSVGCAIREILQAVTSRVQWNKFQCFYAFLVVFAQFIIKKVKNVHLFQDEQPNLLCQHINDFVQFQVEKMISQYKVSNLSIFQRQHMLQIFYFFFQWMLQKQYTTYKISFKDNAHFYPK